MDIISIVSLFMFGLFNGCVDTYFTSVFITNFSNRFQNGFFIASVIYSAGNLGFILEGPVLSYMISILGPISYLICGMFCAGILTCVSIRFVL